jgi:hypothetical protein
VGGPAFAYRWSLIGTGVGINFGGSANHGWR